MPNTTPNLGLIKPLVTENYDIAKVTNENADILDLEVSGKQDILVSGTSIKTINSNSLLGSGDVDVQPTLVSGTNIKTINGSSILSGGDLELLPKNNPISKGLHDLQGGQIKFPATQVPSANANTLDDYEEGTWTPNTSTWTTQPTLQNSWYVKVGKNVQISALFLNGVVQNFGEISGLPFNVGGHGICHFRRVSSTIGGTFGIFDTAVNNKISSIAGLTFTGEYWLLSGTYISTT